MWPTTPMAMSRTRSSTTPTSTGSSMQECVCEGRWTLDRYPHVPQRPYDVPGWRRSSPAALPSHARYRARIAQLVEQLTLIRCPAAEIKTGPTGADVHLIFRVVELTNRHPELATRP